MAFVTNDALQQIVSGLRSEFTTAIAALDTSLKATIVEEREANNRYIDS